MTTEEIKIIAHAAEWCCFWLAIGLGSIKIRGKND
jgi:hypothetical protein